MIDFSRLQRNYTENPLKFGENPTKEDFQYLYIELNLTLQEVGEIVGKKLNTKHLRLFGLQKTKEQKIACIERINRQKYGVSNISQLKSVKEKKEQKSLEKYGVKNISQADAIKAKKEQKSLEKYGTKCPFENSEIKAKIRDTNLKLYGSETFVNSDSFKEKIMNEYGVNNPIQSKEIRNRIQHTNFEHYGVKEIFASPHIQEKIKQTNLERYGVVHSSSCPTVKEKIKSSLQNREDWGFRSNAFKKKSIETNLEKYGCEYSAQKHLKKEALSILKDKNSLMEFILSQDIKTSKVLSEILGISRSLFIKYCHNYNIWHLIDQYSSTPEIELAELFPNIFTKSRRALAPYEIDLYSEEHKFGIEFNGNYWHSEQHGTDKNYHQKKSLLAEEKGIFLYHIWEYEWNDERKRNIIISQINNILGLNKERIFARKCTVEVLSFKQINGFLNENHIQGSCTAKVNLGLHYQGNLVAVMTFGSSRFDKNYQWELLRFCCKKNTSVIGGANKLMQHFIKNYNPQSIISYSHMDKGTGKLYEKLGFKLLRYTGPDYVWTNGYEVLSRYQCQKHILLAQGFKGNSEREIMEQRKFCRVFGCGNKVWIHTIN